MFIFGHSSHFFFNHLRICFLNCVPMRQKMWYSVNFGVWPLKIICTPKLFLMLIIHLLWFWPCILATLFHSVLAKRKNLFSACNVIWWWLEWEWLPYFLSYPEYCLFRESQNVDRVCAHMHLHAFACGYQLQMSPSPSFTVKFFLPQAVCP
jgi:hypothetical protein